MSKGLKDKIAALPDAPGVYIFKDAQGQIIYIGKARSLKKRVQSYFVRLLSAKAQALVAKIADVQYHLSSSESQAQLLEASLIKKYLPPYNISLRDDKSFPLIRITDEDFPVISICRRKKVSKIDKPLYFGPYTNAKLLRQALKAIRRIFGFRSCFRMPKAPCLYYRLKLCPAPCVGKVSSVQYKENIKEIQMFLESRYEELWRKLSDKMKEASAGQKFEEAAKIRDQINALSALGEGANLLSSVNELQDLKNLLQLDRLPLRIEAFDISNIFGKESCGSMVSFYKGSPDKSDYRRFRIKTYEGIDDYKMLREIIQRRYSRLINEKLTLPDLILIDGGRGQLSIAKRQLDELNLNIPVISIAKQKEEIYTLHRKNPIRFKPDAPALHFIQRIRNEAHRFALAYHHILRRKKIIGK